MIILAFFPIFLNEIILQVPKGSQSSPTLMDTRNILLYVEMEHKNQNNTLSPSKMKIMETQFSFLKTEISK